MVATDEYIFQFAQVIKAAPSTLNLVSVAVLTSVERILFASSFFRTSAMAMVLVDELANFARVVFTL